MRKGLVLLGWRQVKKQTVEKFFLLFGLAFALKKKKDLCISKEQGKVLGSRTVKGRGVYFTLVSL